MKYLLLAITLFTSSLIGMAQEEQESSEEQEYKNFVMLFIGSTHIIQSGINMPTFGVEYGHELFKNFGVGAIVEYEAGQHIIGKEEENGEAIDLIRSNALLLLPTLHYAFFNHMVILTAGYGIEFEQEENLGLLKLGLSLELELKNPRWRAIPSVSWDHTKLFDGIVYGFSVEYGF